MSESSEFQPWIPTDEQKRMAMTAALCFCALMAVIAFLATMASFGSAIAGNTAMLRNVPLWASAAVIFAAVGIHLFKVKLADENDQVTNGW